MRMKNLHRQTWPAIVRDFLAVLRRLVMAHDALGRVIAISMVLVREHFLCWFPMCICKCLWSVRLANLCMAKNSLERYDLVVDIHGPAVRILCSLCSMFPFYTSTFALVPAILVASATYRFADRRECRQADDIDCGSWYWIRCVHRKRSN